MQPPWGIAGSRTLVTMIRTWCLAVGPQSLKLPSGIEPLHPPYKRGAGTSHRSKNKSAEMVMSSKCGERKGIEPFSPVPKTGILPLDQRSSRKLPSEIESLHSPYQGGAGTSHESKKVHGENRTLIYGAENRCANPLHHADGTTPVDVIGKKVVAESHRNSRRRKLQPRIELGL